ncbi:conserved hypothetical protein [Beutenbergia cavernae DSM 12333]|uniref:DUF4838 domain-containing protein n=1 Tax=Beutenbergia cavernae (strain ATCC BAA-8 / DSM 12333 / CCUG 43141 / JCM 11478 / NBRC 16432 / NCIMB 13614 / HKI 0122) TaxID=471853 RepID=C5BX27_BEUC1|nr:DUF4838 domain-containing protein [Beutenbergia cavernae]ACQ78702.1 conserved hypothetical protein [Beutenbergia cavernae DSM 12333]
MTTPPAPSPSAQPWFTTRGIVLTWDDVTSYDWPALAARAGLTTVSVHTSADGWASPAAHELRARCAELGLAIEEQQHALDRLLPRALFDTAPGMFRAGADGVRTPDANCCASSPDALDVIAEHAVTELERSATTTDRFYFWADDGGGWCHCPRCSELSPSDQSLLISNHVMRALRRVRPAAQLSHLAYQSTMAAPVATVPEKGVFLEFAPFFRTWEVPLSRTEANGPGWDPSVPDRSSPRAGRRDMLRVSHAEYLDRLDENLTVFPAATAQVLEYWLDVSLFSDWTMPAVELPWSDGVLEADLDTYGSRGIRHVTTFGAYMNGEYFASVGGVEPVERYGRALAAWRPR